MYVYLITAFIEHDTLTIAFGRPLSPLYTETRVITNSLVCMMTSFVVNTDDVNVSRSTKAFAR